MITDSYDLILDESCDITDTTTCLSALFVTRIVNNIANGRKYSGRGFLYSLNGIYREIWVGLEKIYQCACDNWEEQRFD